MTCGSIKIRKLLIEFCAQGFLMIAQGLLLAYWFLYSLKVLNSDGSYVLFLHNLVPETVIIVLKYDLKVSVSSSVPIPVADLYLNISSRWVPTFLNNIFFINFLLVLHIETFCSITPTGFHGALSSVILHYP